MSSFGMDILGCVASADLEMEMVESAKEIYVRNLLQTRNCRLCKKTITLRDFTSYKVMPFFGHGDLCQAEMILLCLDCCESIDLLVFDRGGNSTSSA